MRLPGRVPNPLRVYRAFLALGVGAMLIGTAAKAQTLDLPPRAADAISGTEFARRVAPLTLQERENELLAQVTAGNIPGFLRKLCPVSVTNVTQTKTNCATFYATADYLAVGSDDDYFLLNLSPNTGQRLADALHCSLPTPEMVDAIYAAAEVKLPPAPILPTPAMTTVPVFSNHNAIVRAQRAAQLPAHPLGALVAGHQKDVVISAKLASAPGKVAIYGWHQTNGVPIQPLYLKHTATWVDYSQCTRLVQQKMTVNGNAITVAEVLADPALAGLLSNEGPIPLPRYPTNALPQLLTKTPTTASSTQSTTDRTSLSSPTPPDPWNWGATNSLPSPALKGTLSPSDGERTGVRGHTSIPATTPADARASGVLNLVESPQFDERITSFTFHPEVKVRVNAPGPSAFAPGRKVLLIFYALPNGNTTDQTVGKLLQPGDDWHYDIQHIGAQTRFLRERLKDRAAVVVVYLEAASKSWPAWRKAHGDQLIPEIVATVKKLFPGREIDTVLSGHSGGGSFIFGYLNAVTRIPDDVVRIAFLDSNYAYDRALGHEQKLAKWLADSDQHYLCVLAYNDAIALLNGKSFVSAAGGTWGKSHAMQRDLAEDFKFTTQTNAEFQRFTALNGRIQFILKENPERKIFHTVQVERNGFIQCMVSGTPNEGKGYEYFGPRAYSEWIEPELPGSGTNGTNTTPPSRPGP